jgi:hypothetical protein
MPRLLYEVAHPATITPVAINASISNRADLTAFAAPHQPTLTEILERFLSDKRNWSAN